MQTGHNESSIARSRFLCSFLCLLSLFAAIAFASEVQAQERRPRRPQPEQTAAPEPTPAPPAEEKPAEKDRWFAVLNGRVHTVSGPVLDGVTILCRNGRIAEIGPNLALPEGCERLDAAGHFVYPGLIAVRSQGIHGGGSPEDGTDVFSLNMSLALGAGITTAVTGDTAAKLTYGTLEDMIVKRGLFESISYTSRDPAGKRRLREGLDRVRQHLRDVADHEEEKRLNPEAKAPDDKWIRGPYATYLRLLKGEATAIADANSAWELLQLAELAETYGIRIVARGAYEAWTVAPRLSRAGMAAIITPRQRVDENPQLNRPTGSTIENARILHEAGMRLAITPAGSLFGPGYGISLGGLAGRDLLHLALEAAFAVRGGLENAQAVKTVTIDAARLLGIDSRVGSIEVGKDADFVITDGDLLHYMTLVRWTVVNGRIAYDKEKEGIYSHIRPGGDADAPPPDDYWPRRLGVEWRRDREPPARP
ncbi:MAG: amidohydrolase family protein [Phycisphaerales bacterium]|nr:amidohydrolase family protein [Phycisphaerales bacterium]